MNEIWIDIIIKKNGITYDYTDLYQVSNLGRIKSLERKTEYLYEKGGNHTISEKHIKLFKSKHGYLKCYLYKQGKREEFSIHRLVGNAFIDNPNNLPQINHIDKNKENNCADNLEWCTNKYNAEYSKNKPIIQYNLDFKKIKEWNSQLNASEETKINRAHISECCRGKRQTAGGYIWRFKEENNEYNKQLCSNYF